MKLTQLYVCVIIAVFAGMQALSCMHVLIVCDVNISDKCQNLVAKNLSSVLEDVNHSFALNISVVTDVDNLENGFENLRERVEVENVNIIIAFGNSLVANLAGIVAKDFGIQLLQYSTSTQRNPLYPELTVVFNPTMKELTKAMMTLVGDNIKNAYIVCQDSLLTDGFFDAEIRTKFGLSEQQWIILSQDDSDYDLRLKLLTIHDSGFRLVIMHTTPRFFNRFINLATEMSLFESGFAWILTEKIFSPSTPTLDNMPFGLLAIEGFEENFYDIVLQHMVSAVEEATKLLNQAVPAGSSFVSGAAVTGKHIEYLLESIRSNKEIFNYDSTRKNVQFRLLNHVRDLTSGQLTWKQVGFIRDDYLDLETVVWPGNTIFGPVGTAREHYTIVTRPAEPFMFARGPVTSKHGCSASTACLLLKTYKPIEIKAAIESFRTNSIVQNISYEIYCCEGIVVDVLHRLAVELNFDFHLYFQGDENYGTKTADGRWTGMVGDVANGAADMMVGAISITSSRMEAITFSEPFYYAGFNMLSKNLDRVTSILAFLSPFEAELWLTIIASAIVVAIATSILEWNSPFGLSPWGRRRKKNYTLGSGLTMVFSLWFGHTVSTKTPKSWPSKVLQNFWAAFSIFSIASYTANLAAYLAGNAYSDSTYSILDTTLTSKRVGVIKTSAVEEYTKSINGELHSRLNIYVKSVENAVQKLRSNEIDLYMDDSPILEYALSKIDNNCSVKYAAHDFGETSYGFGLPKGSWLKAKLNPLILNYVELGYIEDLKWRYLGKQRLCESVSEMVLFGKTIQYSLDHTGGLFLVLLVAIGVSFLILILEHVMYFVLLPRLKKMPPTSIWKNRNMEFFSQRLYRAINTVTVRPAAKSIVRKVRAKKFNILLKTAQTRSVPANLNSYQNADGTVANLAGNVALKMFARDYIQHGNNTRRHVFTVSSGTFDDDLLDELPVFSNIDEITQNNKSFDKNLSTKNLLTGSCPNDMYLYFENPVLNSDFEAGQNINNQSSPQAGRAIQANTSLPKIVNFMRNSSNLQIQRSTKKETTFKEESENNQNEDREQMTRCKRYETWPSPKTRKKSLKRNTHQPSSFSEADQYCPYCGQNCKAGTHTRTDFHSKTRSMDGSLNACKDNRLKSSIRRHAMAEDHFSHSLDDHAVESLSKEDLLVLWKRSEIELQTKLNRIISQNNQLRQLIDIAEAAECCLQEEARTEDATDESIKITKL